MTSEDDKDAHGYQRSSPNMGGFVISMLQNITVFRRNAHRFPRAEAVPERRTVNICLKGEGIRHNVRRGQAGTCRYTCRCGRRRNQPAHEPSGNRRMVPCNQEVYSILHLLTNESASSMLIKFECKGNALSDGHGAWKAIPV